METPLNDPAVKRLVKYPNILMRSTCFIYLKFLFHLNLISLYLISNILFHWNLTAEVLGFFTAWIPWGAGWANMSTLQTLAGSMSVGLLDQKATETALRSLHKTPEKSRHPRNFVNLRAKGLEANESEIQKHKDATYIFGEIWEDAMPGLDLSHLPLAQQKAGRDALRP